MIIEKLAQYPSIGWDFDLTLYGNEVSPLLHDFINNHPDIDHYIITFRTHGMVTAIPYDLAQYENAPEMDAFKNIFSIPEKLWLENSFAINKAFRNPNLPLSKIEKQYKCWKGLICKTNSIPVLIDDDTENTRMGCTKYNIDLIHPNELF